VFAGLLDEFRGTIRLTAASLLWGGVAAAAGVTGVLFLSVAGFLWIQQRYDPVTACLVLGAAYVVLALIALAVVAFMRRVKIAPPAPTPAQAQWWTDPVAVMTALQLVRTIGIGKLLPLAVLGAVAAGFVF
jgi:hypothetical protein